MRNFVPVTEADLARARRDPEFRERLMAISLDRLWTEINRIRRAGGRSNPKIAAQIREGMELATELGERLRGPRARV